ncbi:Chemotaxis protein CheY [uncultured archaeon]|nr:Chemotaxis protein CheY [uncultured archaeon]
MFVKKERRDPLRILLAEDKLCDQDLMMRLLKNMGLRADLAGNGHEVLDALRIRSYDVILMDIHMPEMDGLETTRIIRQQWHDRSTKIIAITGCNQKGDRETCIQAGMDDYICKPVKREDLDNALSGCHRY